jgi:hypothetical protein
MAEDLRKLEDSVCEEERQFVEPVQKLTKRLRRACLNKHYFIVLNSLTNVLAEVLGQCPLERRQEILDALMENLPKAVVEHHKEFVEHRNKTLN